MFSRRVLKKTSNFLPQLFSFINFISLVSIFKKIFALLYTGTYFHKKKICGNFPLEFFFLFLSKLADMNVNKKLVGIILCSIILKFKLKAVWSNKKFNFFSNLFSFDVKDEIIFINLVKNEIFSPLLLTNAIILLKLKLFLNRKIALFFLNFLRTIKLFFLKKNGTGDEASFLFIRISSLKFEKFSILFY